MSSTKALRVWVRFVRKLNPKIIAPPHGAIFRDDHVENFLNWLGNLKVGIDVFEKEFYGD